MHSTVGEDCHGSAFPQRWNFKHQSHTHSLDEWARGVPSWGPQPVDELVCWGRQGKQGQGHSGSSEECGWQGRIWNNSKLAITQRTMKVVVTISVCMTMNLRFIFIWCRISMWPWRMELLPDNHTKLHTPATEQSTHIAVITYTTNSNVYRAAGHTCTHSACDKNLLVLAKCQAHKMWPDFLANCYVLDV